MDLANCRRCGTLFVQQKLDYCAECSKWFTETYARIRDYVRTHPNRTLWDIHIELDLPLSVVQEAIKFSEDAEKK